MSKTPRTDAFVDMVWDAEKLKHPIREYNDLADFARQLETENAELLEALEACESLMAACWKDDVEELVRARAAIAKAKGE